MSSSVTPRSIGILEKRLSFPLSFQSLMPLHRLSSSSVTEKTMDEYDYSDILTDVTDIDEILAEQCEAASEQPAIPLPRRFGSFGLLAEEINVPASMVKTRKMSTTTLESVQEDEQLVCAPLLGASEYAELLFDAETPLASDEDLALRSIFAPNSMPEPLTRPVTCNQGSLPTPKLLDTGDLEGETAPAAHTGPDPTPEMLDFEASLDFHQGWYILPEHRPRRPGRSLTHPSLPTPTEETATEEPWQLEHDPILQYFTSHSFLPGRDALCDITTCSVAVQYDRDIDKLYNATACFLDNCHDGECTCLEDEMHDILVPGENFILPDDDGDFGLSSRLPAAKNIFELIDELVDMDMLGACDNQEDVSETLRPLPGMFCGTTPQDMKTCTNRLDTVSVDRDDVSVIPKRHAEGLSPTRCSEITYVDADTHQCIAYTAYNQLFKIDNDETRPIVHRDIPDDEDESEIDLSELSHLYREDEGQEASPPREDPYSSKFWAEFTSNISQPPAQRHYDSRGQSAARQQCLPYGLYSSNLSHRRRRLPRLTLATQLLPQPEPLSIVEEEQLSHSSSSSSGESIDSADHRGFVKPLTSRRQSFLDDDEDEVEQVLDSPMTPSSTLYVICEDMFMDAVWDSSPDLALIQPSRKSYASTAPIPRLPPPPLLEAFEIEIHDRLTFIFNCLNNGRSDELPALAHDLHWTLCALAHEYPVMTLLDSLGAAVEILVERLIASPFAS